MKAPKDMGQDEFIQFAAKTVVAREKSFRRLITENNIRLPHDMELDDMFLSSDEEPDFLDNLKINYPEYFI